MYEGDEGEIEERHDWTGELGSDDGPAIVFFLPGIASFSVEIVSQSNAPYGDEEGGDEGA